MNAAPNMRLRLSILKKASTKVRSFSRSIPRASCPRWSTANPKSSRVSAICLYLGDKFPEANLAPKINAPERGRYLSLMVYSTSQLEPALGDTMLGAQTSLQRGWTDFETARNVIEGELGAGPYLFGEWFTAADVMIGSLFMWRRMLGGQRDRPKLEAYVDRLLARPAAPKLGG